MPDGYDLQRFTYRRMALCGGAGHGRQHYYCGIILLAVIIIAAVAGTLVATAIKLILEKFKNG